jgi:hypothetical protein
MIAAIFDSPRVRGHIKKEWFTDGQAGSLVNKKGPPYPWSSDTGFSMCMRSWLGLLRVEFFEVK